MCTRRPRWARPWLLLALCKAVVLGGARADAPEGLGHAVPAEDHAEPRRTTAVNVEFALEAVANSNVGAVARSSDNVDVYAGVTYPVFRIHATSGLGASEASIRVKLVLYDLAATGQDCATVSPYMGPPFDDSTDEIGRFVGSPDETLNSFADVTFPYAGRFRLCYSSDGVLYQEMAPGITVLGAEENTNRFWCPLQLMQRQICADYNTEFPPVGCECKGKVIGFKRNNETGDFIQTGLPNPAYPEWKVTMVDHDQICGGGLLTREAFNKGYNMQEVTNYQAYEVHNVGMLVARGDLRGSLKTWKLCYCPGFAENDAMAVCGTPSQDYPQTLGILITISVLTGKEVMTVFPTIRFNLIINCGNSREISTGDDLSPGGCTSTDDSRYKIVRRSTETDKPYYDPTNGCRFLPQAATTIDEEKVLGGHIGPSNCVNLVDCRDSPEVVGPKTPTYNSVQMDATYNNGVMVEAEYDVCYCDGDCLNSMNWFKAGLFSVRPVTMSFAGEDLNPLAVGRLVVNTRSYVLVGGTGNEFGNWSIEGTKTREMKILEDNTGHIDKTACLNQPQPNGVSGHQLVSGNTDYTEPLTVFQGGLQGDRSKPTGQRYGTVCGANNNCQPNIRIAVPGWYAVCYCDSNCNEQTNWAVFGRALVAGPLQMQQWVRYAGVEFDITVRGWGLQSTNRIQILSYAQELSDCLPGATPSFHVSGAGTDNMPAILNEASASASITSMEWDPVGTRIKFSGPHGLRDGDYIHITGVNSDDQANEAYGNVHEVFFRCDNVAESCHEIMIAIRYPAAEFPAIGTDSVDWTRVSELTYSKIKIKFGNRSPDGRGYIICWAPVPEDDGNAFTGYIGQAGTLTIKEPLEMTAKLGLTTVMPEADGGRGAPVVISFTTGDNIARYEEVTGRMQLVVSIMQGLWTDPNSPLDGNPILDYIDVLDWRQRDKTIIDGPDASSPETATQTFCGDVFLELWSEDPDGFPMPEGCYYTMETSDATPNFPVEVGFPQMVERKMHIVFGPRNHLKKGTMYMMVMNMNIVMANTDSTRVLRADPPFPDQGPVWIWSMDDIDTNPSDVVELGRALLHPVGQSAQLRQPPRDNEGNLALETTDGSKQDPKFHEIEGFRINPRPTDQNLIVNLTGYCIKYDFNEPDLTPSWEYECMPCYTEQDCGNGDDINPPNPLLIWCRSPIDPTCLIAGGDATRVPTFKFSLKAHPSYPITGQSVIRLFLHPLTAWDLDGCEVAWDEGGCYEPDGGGACGEPTCSTEGVINGPKTQLDPEFPINILRIRLPIIMGTIRDGIEDTIKVAGLYVPSAGFFPQGISAELMCDGEVSPDYWPNDRIPVGGARLYFQPRILAASLVTHPGDGNAMQFRGDQGNLLYVRLVSGANLYADPAANGGVTLDFNLPSGYRCYSPEDTPVIPDLNVLEGRFPTTKGDLGLRTTNEDTPRVNCRVTFPTGMILYARSVVFFELRVINPDEVMKRDDARNYWSVDVRNVIPPAVESYDLPTLKLSSAALSYCPAYGGDAALPRFLCQYDLGYGYDGNVSVLGKLEDVLISPTNYGVGNENMMYVFFRTEQEVGSLVLLEAEVHVRAPSGYEFGAICSAQHLDASYYIPEGNPPITQRLPSGAVIQCTGDTSSAAELTYNVARIRTNGRLLAGESYGFALRVTNAPRYVRLHQENWYLSTFDGLLNGVDGSVHTAKANEESPIFRSWGSYQQFMQTGSFGVTFADLLPTPRPTPPTEIIVLPIVVSLPMRRSMRVTAPAGYHWDFEQYEFRFKARATGVLESLIVDGVDADMPISGIPAKPISPPQNVLTVDYMQSAWTPGVRYGFAAKIRVPMIPPTHSANHFTIEFGYNEDLHENRLEAGVTPAQLVKRIIDGAIHFETSIANKSTTLTFSMRTVTPIPNGGGILITGPPNFRFDAACQPKPATGYPELPYDSLCMYEATRATGQPEVSIIAGPSGIPPAMYKFSLPSVTPPQPVGAADAGMWQINSYSLMSARTTLDYSTTMSSVAVGIQMYNASLQMHPKKEGGCPLTERDAVILGQPKTYCDFEHWQFYPELGGGRDDRPGRSSQLIFNFQLQNRVQDEGEMVVTAPVGYEFDSDCKVATYPSSLIFDKFATLDAIAVTEMIDRATFIANAGEESQTVPNNVALDPALPGSSGQFRRFVQRFKEWPSDRGQFLGCSGRDNIARIRFSGGLDPIYKFLFRLEVLKNPMFTPEDNNFVLEYNGEASEPFPGVPIWAFSNLLILPTTTAASTQEQNTVQEVTIHIQPLNTIPFGGHLRITAPSGFLIETDCHAQLSVHPDHMPNLTALAPGDLQLVDILRWTEFATEGDVVCQGDVTASSRARIIMQNNEKRMKSGVRYIVKLMVTNPQTTTPEADMWRFESFEQLVVSETQRLDSSDWPGFPINSAVQTFGYINPSSYNALVPQLLDFTMSFPENVVIGDTIEIVAPISCFFSLPGDNRCPEFRYMEGSLSRTQPMCGANTIMWHLQEESIPAYAQVRFMVQMINPPATPEVNLFQVRQIASDGRRKTSRMIPGFEIIPELLDISLTFATAPPLPQCRPNIDVTTNLPCQAAGSIFALVIRFTPTQNAQMIMLRAHVGGHSFDFLGSTCEDADGNDLPTDARSSEAIVVMMAVYRDQPVALRINGVVAPRQAGTAKWSVTTLGTVANTPDLVTSTTIIPPIPCRATGECGTMPYPLQRRDETLNHDSFGVLGYLDVLSTTFVNPIYFGEPAAVVTFEIEVSYNIERTHILQMTRPQGYSFLADSLMTYRGLQVGQNGLDTMRRFGTLVTNPSDYYIVIEGNVQADDKILFSIRASLPTVSYPDKYWFFRTHRVLPLLDVDGEVLNDTQVPYPWIGRELEETGSNDGAFGGFLLVDEVPFTVTPQLNTPGAKIRLTFNFNVQSVIQANLNIRIEITGPQGFTFSDSCFYTINTPIGSTFAKCTGFRHTATLVTLRNELVGSDITAHLEVTNPPLTPEFNYWSVAVFTDDSTQYVSYYQELSYEITGMPVIYKGNNQLGESATGFFTFEPVRTANSEVLVIVVTPPPNAGYRVFCTGMSPLGFVRMPQCNSGGPNDPLTLRWDNATLVPGISYTFGVHVYNPGGRPAESSNYWGISLKDGNLDTFDANLNVPGLELRSIPIRCMGLGWTTAAPRVIGVVLIQLRILHSIPAGIVTLVEIRAPEGIMYNEDLSAVKIIPMPLPLKTGNPTNIAGDILSLNLDENAAISPALYNIRFEVSNPATYPNDNTWGVAVKKNIEVEFSDVRTGYVQGQASPFDLSLATSYVSRGTRHVGVGPCTVWCIILGLVASNKASRRARP